MLTHAQIWAAIDALAERQGISASSLARRAGLDPTTFNRSKRINTAGQARWPSTESIAKILAATGASIDEFLGMLRSAEATPPVTVPFRALDTLQPGHFDATGLAKGDGWDAIPFPGSAVESCFALEVHGEAYAPLYADGDVLIASAAVARRRGDRVVILAEGDGVILGTLGRETSSQTQVTRLGQADPSLIAARDIRLIARIIWASQ
jgi:phage repressor protein C with HTH and peptisase S24 domain